jgi:predicted transcriptional regulator
MTAVNLSNSNGSTVNNHLIDKTIELASAYVSNNSVSVDEFPRMLESIHHKLKSFQEEGPSLNGAESLMLKPAVSIQKSIQPDYLICLEDGKKLKMLKRYLRVNYNMTPEAYRKKWGLSQDYPMAAPLYSKRRSEIAKDNGLGKIRMSDKAEKESLNQNRLKNRLMRTFQKAS